MGIFEFFAGLEESGISVDLSGKNLKINAPKGSLTPGLLKELKEKKQDIIHFLQEHVQRPKGHFSIEPVEEKEYYRLSSAQKRLFVLQQLEPGASAYNMSDCYIIEGEINRHRFERSFLKLIVRHESLRTSFSLIAGQPVQRVHSASEIEFKIEYSTVETQHLASQPHEKRESRPVGDAYMRPSGGQGAFSKNRPQHPQKTFDLGQERRRGWREPGSDVTHLFAEFIRSFDLSCAPLLRVGLIKQGDSDFILMVDMHHIISDGNSIGVFIRDFIALYNNEPVDPLHIRYRDFSYWQNKIRDSEEIKKQERYWLERFADELPVLNLPTDFPRPAVKSYAGGEIKFEIDREETTELKALALEHHVTLYILLFAIYTILLAKLSSQEDIIVGTPTAGRRQLDLVPVIGAFINTLCIRSFPRGDKPFSEFLKELKTGILTAFSNQDYQFEELVEKIDIGRDTGRGPLFDVMFVFRNMDTAKIEIPALTIKNYDYENRLSKFDLRLLGSETGKGLRFKFGYSTKLFKRDTIERYAAYFRKILQDVGDNPAILLDEIELLSVEEKEKLIFDFNRTETDYPRNKSLHHLFAEQAAATPGRVAVVGHSVTNLPVVSEPGSLSYGELSRISGHLADLLIENGIKTGGIVGIMLERSVEMIVGILSILKSGAAYLPIDPIYPPERKTYMLQDSNASMIITTRSLVEEIEELQRVKIKTVFIETGIREQGLGSRGAVRRTMPGNAAYVIYTSGSTGKPKGVLVDHSSVVNLIFSQKRFFNTNKNDRILQFSTICFDASVEQVFLALLCGAVLVLADKETLLHEDKFSEFINRQSLTHLHAVPSFLKTIKLDETSHLKRIVSGGDTCPVELANELSRRGDFYNKYGPTETTVTSIETKCNGLDTPLPRLPIGKPVANTSIYILDKRMNLVPEGIIGEIHIAGDGVARGYLNRPELTSEKFLAIASGGPPFVKSPTCVGERLAASRHIHENQSLIPLMAPRTAGFKKAPPATNILYKTGDLGRWLPDGSIDFLGRIDNQVKIRGFRIEIGEIENQLSKHNSIKEAVVIEGEHKDGDKYLCAYIAAKGAAPSSLELHDYLLQTLPDYMIPAYFITLDRIPLTPSGKVNRKELPEPSIGGTGREYTAPRDGIENKLTEIWSDVLGIEKERIGIDDNFFHLGGHSLKSVTAISGIHKVFGVKVNLADIFKTPTIRGLSERIEKETTGKEDGFIPIKSVELKEYYPLSSAQKRLVILQQMDDTGIGYNMPKTALLEGNIDRQHLQTTFVELINRHESLRTSFIEIAGEPVQRIHDPGDIEFKIEYIEAGSRDLIDRFVRPFDLSKAPLLRVGLIRLPESAANMSGSREKSSGDTHILLIDMHHAVADGLSMNLFVREFMDLYDRKTLHRLRFRYRDFSEWQNKEKGSDSVLDQEKYWLQRFSGEIPVLELPTDYPRPGQRSFAGHTVHFAVGQEQIAALNRLATAEGTTLFMVLFGVYHILLAKLSGQEDIIVGTPTAGRRHADLGHIIGMFVNTLILRNSSSGDMPFRTFLQVVKKEALAAFENQDFQFEELVDKLGIKRDTRRNPLFDVMFVLQNMESTEVKIPDLTLKHYDHEHRIAKFDLMLMGIETGTELQLLFEYSVKLFKPGTIQRYAAYFQKISSEVIDNPEILLGNIELLSIEERQKIIFEFNDTQSDYPHDKTIHQLFAEQAEKTAERTAVINAYTGNVRIDYRFLHHRSDRLAHVLKNKGVGGETIVGLMIERSVEMVITILAILKAGGAYLPIDPGYPRERIEYVLKDSGTKLLLTTRGLMRKDKKPGNWGGQILFVEEILDRVGPRPKVTAKSVTPPPAADLAYIIYTSGTTGKPKGVVIEHRSVVNILTALHREYPLHKQDAYLLKTAYVFDVSVAELFGWFMEGGSLVILEQEAEKDPKKILDVIEKFGITHLNFVPSMFTVFVEELHRSNLNKLKTLKYIFLAGEAVIPGPVIKFRQFGTQIQLENIYGPTEGTVYSSNYSLSRWQAGDTIPIGKPMQNINLYILDKHAHLQPVGVPGELCVAGENLARGYLNRPELTQEQFKRSKIIKSFAGVQGPAAKRFPTHERWFAESVIPCPRGGPGGKKYYKTGDLCKWLPDGPPAGGAAKATSGGVIEFLGRLDDQVKIRGFRIELGEIENRLLQYNAVREAVVTAKEDDKKEKYLCAYIVSKSTDSEEGSLVFPRLAAELREYLAKHLPAYMIPAYFIKLEKIPLNPNGKVDRKALPIPDSSGVKTHITLPRNEIEKKLAGIWSEVLNISPGSIGIDDNFFEIGGHSLKATLLAAKIRKAFDVNITLAEVFKMSTIRKLSSCMEAVVKEKFISIKSCERKEYYPLSPAQKRLFILQGFEKESSLYNTPVAMRVEGDVDRVKLEQAFVKLIERHESLRTSFSIIDDQPVQRIHNPEDIKFKIEYYKAGIRDQGVGSREKQDSPPPLRGHLRASSPEGNSHPESDRRDLIHQIQDFIRPFDLGRDPLLRVGLIDQSGEQDSSCILIIDIHHIVTDGTSMAILTREFMDIYTGGELPVLRLSYRDYSAWQQHDLEKENLLLQDREEYWLDQFTGEIPVLNLPLDYQRQKIQSFSGRTVEFDLNKEETGKLKDIGLEEETTLYMVLLSLFNILLAKVCGQEDIVVGTPAAGRRHADLEPVIGMFINTLALRNAPSGDKSLRDFLKEVKNSTLTAFENQEYQFEELVEKVSLNRDAGRNPLFDVMFSLQNFDERYGRSAGVEIGNLKLKPLKQERNIAKFDMTFTGMEIEDSLYFKIEYSTGLFRKETIDRFISYFRKIISAVPFSLDRKISEIEIISEEEKEQVLHGFNEAVSDYPADKTIHRLFEEMVEKNPNLIALTGKVGAGDSSQADEYHTLTYRELDARAADAAGALTKKGVGPDVIVAFLAERSMEMMIGIFGVLKAGGAYLPIETQYPEVRIQYMLKDSNTKLLLTTSNLLKEVEAWKSLDVEILLIEEAGISLGARCAVPLEKIRSLSTNLAYVIYTSGTTGKPKGTLTTHSNVIRVVRNTNYIDIGTNDRVLQLSNYAFDGSTFDIFGALLNGAALVMIKKEQVVDIDLLADLIIKEEISVFFVTTALFNTLVDLKLDCLDRVRKVLFGGERVSLEHAKKALDYLGKSRVLHVYGPTETTVYATYYPIDRIDEELGTVPIGQPISNTALYILGAALKPVPTGIAGELYIGGDGLARGYLNRPELTSDMFIDYDNKRFLGVQGAIFQKSPLVAEGKKIYKTGDLCRWLSDGNVEFIGRVDQQLKIRGFRIELGEIENQLLNHEQVKEAFVTDMKTEESGDIYLCAYIVIKNRKPEERVKSSQENKIGDQISHEMDAGTGNTLPEEDDKIGSFFYIRLRDYLSQSLPDYMIPSYFVPVEKLPLTPNGKVDRKALPRPELQAGEGYTAPRDQVEKKLAAIWSEILNKERGTIGIDDNFFHSGGHSLKATLLAARINKTFEKKVQLAELFKSPTIREIAAVIAHSGKNGFADLERVPESDYYALSYNQKRLYIIHQMDPESGAFHMPGNMRLDHEVDETAIEKVIKKLAVRHESLRTGFKIVDHEPVQFIAGEVNIPFQKVDLSTLSEGEKKHERDRFFSSIVAKPFDLACPPLFRAALVKLKDSQFELMFNLHHIITDGWSMEILKRDFSFFYDGYKRGEDVEPEPISHRYIDFAAWNNKLIHDEEVKKEPYRFWLEKIEKGIAAVELPVDFKGNPEDRRGAAYRHMIDNDTKERLKKLAEENNTSLFVALFSAYVFLISRFSSREHITVSIIGAGREHVNVQNIIGFFVNSIPIGISVDQTITFSDFLQFVHREVIDHFRHQGYPIELVYDELNLRYPDVNISFNMFNVQDGTNELDLNTFKPYHIEELQDVKFEIEPYVFEFKNGIDMRWTYRKGRFEPGTIEFIVNEYIRVIDFFTANSGINLAEFRKNNEKKSFRKRRLHV